MNLKNTHMVFKIVREQVDEAVSHGGEMPSGATVELTVFEDRPSVQRETPTMALLRSWLEEDATDDPEAIRTAEEDLREFKRNMNLPRKQAGARLLYPEVE